MRKFLLGALVAILITAVWYFFVVGPINERKDIAQTDLETAESQEFTLRTTLSRLQKIEENQLEYATAIGQLQTAMPRLAELIDDLSFLADENGIVLANISFATPTLAPDTDIYVIGASMSIEGQYFEILGFLYGAAELDRVMTIENLSMTPGADDAGFHSMSASLSGSVYTTSDLGANLDLAELLEAVEEAAAEAVEEAVEEALPDAGADDEAAADTTTTTTAGA
jgi:Tfp pilus assembly protein PilO